MEGEGDGTRERSVEPRGPAGVQKVFVLSSGSSPLCPSPGLGGEKGGRCDLSHITHGALWPPRLPLLLYGVTSMELS
ncbi:hypothetical protein Mapa_015776 [Marchantia paleacea]|nr:hypothetical protein Mapa_015776 [Marchantia paleacea]